MEFHSLPDLFNKSVLTFKDKSLFVYLEGKAPFKQTHITFEELQKASKLIAINLQKEHIFEERALLLFPCNLDYIKCFWGILYSGGVAVPVYPPTATKHLERLVNVVKDSQSKFIITTKKIFKTLDMLKEASIFLSSAKFLFLEDLLTTNKEYHYAPPAFHHKSVAILQYTSGSTGNPKGVILTHNNLIENLHMIIEGYECTHNDIGVTWLPLYHDMGLIGGCIMPSIVGLTTYIMDPRSIIRPVNWLKAITQFKCTLSMAPNFGYERCLTEINNEEIFNLNLSFIRLLSNGAEPIRANTMVDFIKKFSTVGLKNDVFYPSYGLAEATLIVTTKKHWQTENIKNLNENNLFYQNGSIVTCGSTLGKTKIEIAELEKNDFMKSQEIGEIVISGPCVSAGYWNMPELTNQVFHNHINDNVFLRTGDLGFKDEKGELYIVGRIKDVINFRGKNYYAEDIEALIKNTDTSLRNSVITVFSIFINNSERIVALIEAKKYFSFKNKMRALKEKLSLDLKEIDIPYVDIVFVKSKSIKRTSSGKVRRQETKKLFIDGKIKTLDHSYSNILQTLKQLIFYDDHKIK